MATRTAVDVQITVDHRQADAMLRAIEATLLGANLFQYLRDFMMPYMRERARRRFQGEGDDASGLWDQLSWATVDIRERQGWPGEHPINHRTGELENFMRRGAVDFMMQPDAASMFYPGKPPTRAIREKLTTAQKGRPSARNFLGLGDTPPRPVAVVNMADMSYFLNSFTFWFGKEVQQHFGMFGTGINP